MREMNLGLIFRITVVAVVAFFSNCDICLGKSPCGLQVSWNNYEKTVYRDGSSISVGFRNTSKKSVLMSDVYVGDRKLSPVVDDNRSNNKKEWLKRGEKRGDYFLAPENKAGDVM